MRKYAALLALVTCSARADFRAEMDAFTTKAVSSRMAVVVVQNDRVIYKRGPEMPFYIASSTKAFTAMAAAVLATEGRIDLDAPITDYWKDVALTPPLDAKRVSLRDLLAMRPGFANDTVNFRSALAGNIDSEQELLRLLRVYSREAPRTFRYSNMSYVVAATVLEKAAGKSWRELITENVLAPLGMNATSMEIPAGAWVAKTPETMNPAGGMFMTTGDAARWLIAMLNDGRIDNKQALPKRAVQLVQSEQTTNIQQFRAIKRFAWGLGEDLGTYDGELIVHRFGGFKGAYSHISFMPERHIGVAVFSDGSGAAADAVALFAYDRLRGKPGATFTKDEQPAPPVAPQRRQPSHPLAYYAGSFVSDRLGTLIVSENGGKLEAKLGVLRAELVPAGGDNFMMDLSGEGEFSPVTITDAKLDWGGRIFEKKSAGANTRAPENNAYFATVDLYAGRVIGFGGIAASCCSAI